MDTRTGLDLFNAIATAGKTLREIAQGVTTAETKKQLTEVYDELMNLKGQVADLEDENRNLKAKLRFKGEDFEFKNPFWYETAHEDRPLCAKCFAEQKATPMSNERKSGSRTYRRCLGCGQVEYLTDEPARPQPNRPASPWS